MSTRFVRHTQTMAAIGGLALVAVLVMGVAYVTSEEERQGVLDDRATVSGLRGLAQGLSETLSAQESSIDVYLLSGGPEPLARFAEATTDEARITAEVQAAATELPDVQAAVSHLSEASAIWRTTFAEPAIAAMASGDPLALEPFTTGSASQEEPIHAAFAAITAEFGRAEVGLNDRSDALNVKRTATAGFGLAVTLVASVLGMWLVRRYGRATDLDALHASILNSFTEVTSFAVEDTEVAASSLEALTLMVHPDAAVTHVFNRSQDRAVPEATMGDAIAEVLPLNALSRCAGMRRGSMYVTVDASAPLSVHCPVYPVTTGTLACVPLNSGESVGTVHIYWARPNALPLEMRSNVMRIVEHAALAIANRRLMAALQGQASTDARTGLANSRAFDQALEDALEGRQGDEPIAVLMLDIDRFKDFNDRHGHPAGDDALRVFANVLQSCMREGDVAARYGGEEFTVLLPGVDRVTAAAVAERIRSRTESTVLSLAPGITDRITVSIGIAVAPSQALDRLTLLRIADEALYVAKQSGRNRVEFRAGDLPALESPAAVVIAIPSLRESAKTVKEPIDVRLGGHVIDHPGTEPGRAA